eukprot:gnl/TRDRNA2_/TRDRNA2_39919_c1_seq1.p1 gnl/TRDRNA2_/TRDRNA2_39919_c1~~gnl/TRDRNA2_/TRDRNA2_39919_c1_seq1.p1  ORF type:complete len:229 (-),score=37.26 gnl/TRDRNA2_/TRDRNA2_39919_c1_seq1:300-986(-)
MRDHCIGSSSIPAWDLQPPPGLEPFHYRSQAKHRQARLEALEPAYVCVQGLPESSEPAYVSIAEPAAKSVQSPQYQVLLCGLPQPMTHPVVIRKMMEQAKLTAGILYVNTFFDDVDNSVLVTFSNSAWAKKCTEYFDGRWAHAGLTVSAIIVGIVPSTKTSMPARMPITLPKPAAPSFMLLTQDPVKCTSPANCDGKFLRSRFFSDASTEATLTFDDTSEESDSAYGV